KLASIEQRAWQTERERQHSHAGKAAPAYARTPVAGCGALPFTPLPLHARQGRGCIVIGSVGERLPLAPLSQKTATALSTPSRRGSDSRAPCSRRFSAYGNGARGSEP